MTVPEGSTAAASKTNFTFDRLLDAAARLKAYKPKLPVGYVFGQNVETILRRAAKGEQSNNLFSGAFIEHARILGVPYWVDSSMLGTHVDCYYDQKALDERVKALIYSEPTPAGAPAKWGAK